MSITSHKQQPVMSFIQRHKQRIQVTICWNLDQFLCSQSINSFPYPQRDMKLSKDREHETLFTEVTLHTMHYFSQNF